MFCLLSFPQSILLAASSLCIFQKAIWMHNKARKSSFIFSQWIFLYRCHLLNVFHPKCPIRPRGYTLLKACSHIIFFLLYYQHGQQQWKHLICVSSFGYLPYWLPLRRGKQRFLSMVWLLLTQDSTPRLLFFELWDLGIAEAFMHHFFTVIKIW